MPSKPIQNLLLVVTGSSASSTAPYMITQLRARMADEVHVLMSHSATRFISPRSLAIYSGHPVQTNLWVDPPGQQYRPVHMEVARWADLVLVMPATAHTLARAAHGLCDDLISTVLVATNAPIIFAPSMNEDMWTSRAVQRNVRILEEELGHLVLGPAIGPSWSDDIPRLGALPTYEVVENFILEHLSVEEESDSDDD